MTGGNILTGPNSTGKKNVNMKVVDDKLKIIDDVPNSAVEMAVKEKFLKKVQRQDRIVEEVKLVLKPAYNTRRITKDAYKEILRKTVPKICHSKHGEINPSKIEKLVQGYIKKYQHAKRKEKKGKTRRADRDGDSRSPSQRKKKKEARLQVLQ